MATSPEDSTAVVNSIQVSSPIGCRMTACRNNSAILTPFPDSDVPIMSAGSYNIQEDSRKQGGSRKGYQMEPAGRALAL